MGDHEKKKKKKEKKKKVLLAHLPGRLRRISLRYSLYILQTGLEERA
jgi:hypothetical protein